MRRLFIYSLGVYFISTSVYIFFFPRIFYELTPGLSAMGPFNLHFIRDVSFAFFVSGSAIIYGAHRNLRELVLFGAAWPFLHALFHIYIWGHRGFPFDQIWFSDIAFVILPGLVSLGLGLHLSRKMDA